MSAGRRRVGGGGVGFSPTKEIQIPTHDEWLEIYEKIKADSIKWADITYNHVIEEVPFDIDDIDSIREIRK